ncbi:ATP-dependent Clp protease adaptor protein ClpS [Sulfurimonas denitrificans DSM 1251]|uniref:ATP-dependent Clp protease adapter protein ClpS n=1 Tax=Sulfurimonas denitrificans (strain ATCC 33889 / DSM 1251) TaxID=326298 RepID=Q30TE2_SULDN|nr:ATP-dependent Clp protease adapter ClpS [Sulfurimonas denitrificans]ABB43739.1 ATP-dependent Clp protease adaptor protein ClpS [Sulfurimonas denitrificans DSM 1251]MDD3442407.1 ATP-dependent Clp protease adapter ClpS [Sulfurimonas denitrificans]
MATNIDLETKEKVKIKYPKKYKVLLLNDDYTSMEFVIDILITIFHKNYEQAHQIMLEIHKKTKGICGIYTYEIAETKVMQVHKKARDNGFALRATMEEE